MYVYIYTYRYIGIDIHMPRNRIFEHKHTKRGSQSGEITTELERQNMGHGMLVRFHTDMGRRLKLRHVYVWCGALYLFAASRVLSGFIVSKVL